jgi:phosphoribosylaminoimidazolecarboxamide formyltransferase/IMP cyclohydrolase
VICDPQQAKKVLDWMKAGEPNADEFRRELAANAEAIVASYALESARYTSGGFWNGEVNWRVASAKYGENPWQGNAYLYGHNTNDSLGLIHFKIEQGTEPSYNNYADIDRLLQTITHIAAGYDLNYKKVPFIAIGGKHGNVCGVAVGSSKEEVIKKMLDGDPRAIFGGLVMMNFKLDKHLSEILLTHGMKGGRRLLDGVMAPGVDTHAKENLSRKGDKCRLLTNKELGKLNKKSLDTSLRTRYVRGGRLLQDNYAYILDLKDKELDKTAKAEEKDILLAWAIGSTSNSNTITLVKNQQLLGNGVGQQDRVSACELAIKRAKDSGHDVKGAVAYSDSFFPFPDGPQALAKAGVRAILASSGSVKDDNVKAVMRKAGVVMYMIPDSKGRGFYAH